MSFMAFSDDELALLRFTCDLFFVDASPLWAIERDQREPSDYAAAYHALVDRGIIDPREFRISDAALNRLAPVTECDARLVHLATDADGGLCETHFYLLDEIAVPYEQLAGKHLFGPDLDTAQLLNRLGRHFSPRRAGGERLELAITSLEVVALNVLLSAVRRQGTRQVSLNEAKALFQAPPPDDALLPIQTSAAAPAAALLLARRPQRARVGALVGDPRWDDALRSLVEKGALRVVGDALWLHAHLVDLAQRQIVERHTFVRADFGDDEFFMRETTFLPVDGSLWWLGPRGAGFGLTELDGDTLRRALNDAVGPLAARRGPGATRRANGGVVRPDPVKV
jgi:hypothetical protein